MEIEVLIMFLVPKKKKHGGFNHSFSDMASSCRTPAGGGREKKEGTEMLWGCP